MTAHNATDEATRETAAALLAAGTTVKRTARIVGVARETVHAWLRDPAFAVRVKAIGDVLAGVVKARIEAQAHEAVDVIVGRMRDPKELGAVRLNAAKYLLDHVVPTLNAQALAAEQTTQILTQIFAGMHAKLSPDSFQVALDVANELRAGTTRQLPSGVRVSVERTEE